MADISALDDLLADEPPKMTKSTDDTFEDDDDEGATDDFSMFAGDFLDDSLPMPERIEALRQAIQAAQAPAEEEGFDLGLDADMP